MLISLEALKQEARSLVFELISGRVPEKEAFVTARQHHQRRELNAPQNLSGFLSIDLYTDESLFESVAQNCARKPDSQRLQCLHPGYDACNMYSVKE